jgi:PAS domain S-box-containing protein
MGQLLPFLYNCNVIVSKQDTVNPREPMRDWPKGRLLLVDDDPSVLSTYKRLIERLGFDVIAAEGAAEALQILERQVVDVVIADYRMPQMNGDTFLEQVHDRWPETVRILNTGLAEMQVVEEAVRRGGIFRLLLKPCDIDKLKLALEDAVDLHERQCKGRRAALQTQADLLNYRKIFRCALDPMMVSNLEGDIIEVNDAFLLSLGCSRDEALELRPTIMRCWQQESCWSEILATLRREGHWSGEVQHRELKRYALLSISTVLDEKGAPSSLVAVEKDISTWKQLIQESKTAQYEVILSLAKMAEYRDPETFSHLERIRGYCRILTCRMAMMPRYRDVIDDAYVEAIAASSPLHDVGKVGIPDAVLLKPGPLSEREWHIMKLHTKIGAEVLAVSGSSSNKTWLVMARIIALQHHERYDGSGYPGGLKGESIDLAARIVSLADAYDAITSKRVYKEARSHADARVRIVMASGSHFDPDVVRAFEATEDEFLQINSRHVDPPAVGPEDDSVLSRVARLREGWDAAG